MEGHAVVLAFLSVTVPVDTQDHTVRREVAKHSQPEAYMHGICWTLPRFTATVPMALQDLTARSEVHRTIT